MNVTTQGNQRSANNGGWRAKAQAGKMRWFFVVDKGPGIQPRIGHPARNDFISTVLDWYLGNTEARVLVAISYGGTFGLSDVETRCALSVLREYELERALITKICPKCDAPWELDQGCSADGCSGSEFTDA